MLRHCDTPSPGQADTPPRGQADTPPRGQADTPSRGQTDTPSPGQADTPSPGQADIPSPGQTDTASPGQVSSADPSPQTPENLNGGNLTKCLVGWGVTEIHVSKVQPGRRSDLWPPNESDEGIRGVCVSDMHSGLKTPLAY